MNKPELHIIILWNNARAQEQKILKDIQTKFKVKNIIDTKWSKEKFSNNINRFYGLKISGASKSKIKEIGTDSFLLCIVEDLNPVYEWMETSRGSEYVNKNLFNAKQLYRDWTEGGHKIHTTNSVDETNHDLTLLTGLNVEDYLKENINDWDGNISHKEQDLIGANGWDSLEQLFYVLNQTTNYLVMRNFEMLPHNFTTEEHGDIDLLVKEYDEISLIANGKRNLKYKKSRHIIKINNKNIPFDFISVNENFHCYRFERDLLKSKILSNGFYRPNNEMYFYSLVQHSLIHKHKVADDYFIKCYDLYKELFNDTQIETLNKYEQFDIYYKKLLKFINDNKYNIVKADDETIYFDKSIANSHKTKDYITDRYNIKNIQEFLVARKSGSGFINYTGEFNNNKVFIKYNGIADSSKREYISLKLLDSELFPKPILYRYDGEDKLFISSFEKGISLKDIIDSKTLENYNTVKIAEQLLKAQQILYKNSIIHRDIKPDNILIDDESNIKLLDFQFAVSNNRKELLETNDLKSVNNQLTALGEDFRYGEMHWDDAYSISKIINIIENITPNNDIKKVQKDIENEIGKLCFKINIQNIENKSAKGIRFICEISKTKTPNTKTVKFKILGITLIKYRNKLKTKKKISLLGITIWKKSK